VIAGFISGAHLGYLNSAQQVFQEQYALGELFPLYFAFIALSLGMASFLNARLVMRFGMRSLVRWSLLMVVALSIVAIAMALVTDGQPPLELLIIYLLIAFFCVGILFGNNNSLAMQPLGHIAGIGSAVVGSLSTLIAVPLGMLIGQSYNGTILPLVTGIAILAAASLIMIRWTDADSSNKVESLQP
jgi:DHA1 family bicyclomycin/chloramphenicol resistance-like MFS transporter